MFLAGDWKVKAPSENKNVPCKHNPRGGHISGTQRPQPQLWYFLSLPLFLSDLCYPSFLSPNDSTTTIFLSLFYKINFFFFWPLYNTERPFHLHSSPLHYTVFLSSQFLSATSLVRKHKRTLATKDLTFHWQELGVVGHEGVLSLL